MTPPLVSVLIPCYNLGAYLNEAVQSVLSQTAQNFEILIIDDGSTDEQTCALLKSARWPHTTVFHTENRGLARARNYLIARARGTYLSALDADDKLHPQFFERTLAEFDRDPSLAFVSTHLQMFGDEDRQWPSEDRCDLPALLSEDTVITPAVVRRDAVLAVGGYDENMPGQGNEDWDLWISLVEAGYRGVIVPEILFYYRRRRGSMCDQCTTGQLHLDLIGYLIRKHGDSYGTHLLDVLLRKEAVIGQLRHANVRIESELGSYLEPTLALRRAELHALKTKLESARLGQNERGRPAVVRGATRQLEESRREYAGLQEEYQRSRSEVHALRSSASWKLTAPLRSLYDVLLGRRSSP